MAGSAILRKVYLPIVTNSECEHWYNEAGRHQIIQNEFICAGYKEGGRDSCQVRAQFTDDQFYLRLVHKELERI